MTARLLLRERCAVIDRAYRRKGDWVLTFLCSRLRVSLVVVVLWHSLVMAFQSGAQYPSGEALTDPVALLQKRLERREIELKFEPRHGYLRSVLSQLGIPV